VRLAEKFISAEVWEGSLSDFGPMPSERPAFRDIRCRLGPLVARPSLQRFWQKWTSFGFLGMGFGNYDERYNGERRFIAEWVAKDPGCVCIDAGANEGAFSQMMLRAGASYVHAFEPHPGAYSGLKRRSAGRAISPVNAALGAAPGDLELWCPGNGRDFCRVTAFKEMLGNDATSTVVPVVALDDYCAEHQIEHVRLLKIDVEGYEPEVLKGASRMIREERIDGVTFEVNGHHAYVGFNLVRASELLPGFSLYRLLPNAAYPVYGAGIKYRAGDDVPRLCNIAAVRADTTNF
jgi:FkbM family methyltransferase